MHHAYARVTYLTIFFSLENLFYQNTALLFQYDVVDVKSSELMGYFYLDMHPRDGKYGHACVMPLQPGCINVQTVSQNKVKFA